MKKIILSLVVMTMVVLFSSCGSTKKVPYLQNADSISYAASRGLYDAKIMPKDALTISVNTTDNKAAIPFNLVISNSLNASSQISSGHGSMLSYLVDNEGNINFPVIGKLHVVGMTIRECEEMIKEKIKPYMAATENPIVTVRMSSFKVSVLGEVGRSGQFTVSSAKISILEALAQAGDLTIYGKRDNVMLIREDATGQKATYRINLNDANLINSPLYYLQQNDIIYVEPNSVKTKNASIGTITTLSMSAFGTLMSLTNLIINLAK